MWCGLQYSAVQVGRVLGGAACRNVYDCEADQQTAKQSRVTCETSSKEEHSSSITL